MVFSRTRSLTANQIQFVNLVIDFLTQSGGMRSAQLYDAPFSVVDTRDNGVMAKCLYCGSHGDTREHVIPAAFGEFRDAPELRAPVCAVCNNQRLGLLDEQVSRCGP